MDLTNILKYQEADAKLFQVEQKLKNSPTKKKANDLLQLAKKAQATSNRLEQEANEILKEIENVKANYEQNKKSLDSLVSKDIDSLSEEGLDKILVLKNKIQNNLNSLEKMLQKCAETINLTLSEFNKTKKAYEEAKAEYLKCKAKIDEEDKALQPERERLQKELNALEKSVEKNVLAEYKKRRAEMFPVIVPLEGEKFCGHCRMEIAMIAVSKLKDLGYITCEHCKRLVYKS